MKIVFFSFYYPPDLCAGSFRAIALVQALSFKINSEDEIHVITTHPNRYASYAVNADNEESYENVTIHRIKVSSHQGGMADQILAFTFYACCAFRICLRIKPEFIIGTTSRLMTGLLTWFTSVVLSCGYFIDIRDVFSETIRDVLSIKSRLVGRLVGSFFSFIERFVFSHAGGVNVVSEGFLEYFQERGLDTSQWSFFPNGVDSEFINNHSLAKKKFLGPKTVLYTGNVGSGQGLELIIPHVAQRMEGVFKFQIVGDGGTRNLLEKKIIELGLSNVDLFPPVGREQLIQYYDEADILFLHLNDLPVFKRVLPSKIFEYAALGKPIVAGLLGYSAQFVEDNISYAQQFYPTDIDGCVECLHNANMRDIRDIEVQLFVEKFSRKSIMDKMAQHILSIV